MKEQLQQVKLEQFQQLRLLEQLQQAKLELLQQALAEWHTIHNAASWGPNQILDFIFYTFQNACWT